MQNKPFHTMKNNILLKSALALAIVDLVLIVAILLQVNNFLKDVLEAQNRQLEIEAMKGRLEKLQEIEKAETKIEEIDLDTSKWLTYKNTEYGFEIKYPNGLNTEEGKRPVAIKDGKVIKSVFVLSFKFKSAPNNRFMVLPEGEFDYGLPFEEPKTISAIISGRDTTRKDWTLKNGNILTIINFKDYPKQWNQYHRIDIFAPAEDIEIFYKMLESFKFIY